MTTPEPDLIAKQVAEIKSEFDLGGYFSDRTHTEKAEQLLDALADQLRAALAATPEPVTGATQDPRMEPAAEFVLQQFGSKSGSAVPVEGHRLIARRFLAAADAADAAAGIRRVPAEEFATSVKLAQNEGHRLWRMVNAYNGELLCPRCGNGYPGCTDGFPHAETCGRYRYGRDTCTDCDAVMAAEAESERVGGAS